MDIYSMQKAYSRSLQNFNASDVLNVYSGQRHSMMMRGKDYAAVFSDSSYRELLDELEMAENSNYPFDQIGCYEKELSRI